MMYIHNKKEIVALVLDGRIVACLIKDGAVMVTFNFSRCFVKFLLLHILVLPAALQKSSGLHHYWLTLANLHTAGELERTVEAITVSFMVLAMMNIVCFLYQLFGVCLFYRLFT
jgi:hypothetical protein